MATVGMIFGGTAGFFSALVALIVFNASWMLAFGLWAMGGFGVFILLFALSQASTQVSREVPPTLIREHA